jgi:hypothetical protein
MALQDNTTPPSSFTWGANGARMTPEDIAAQKKVAAAMMEKGSDTSPFPYETRGAGIWTQGLARVAKGVIGGYEDGEASKASQANAADNKAMIANMMALYGGGAATPAAQSVATSGTVPAVLARPSVAAPSVPGPNSTASEVVTGADGTKIPIYGSWNNNNVPSPLDPPSGQDRVNMIATALGEEKPGSPAALGAINTIRNRAVDGGYGGDTPTAVVLAPKQYSANNDPANRAALLARATANTPEVAKVSDAIDQAYGTGKYVNAGPNDPTEGKTHYYDPASMVPAGAVPSWAQGKPFQQIGQTRFYDDPDEPAAAPVQVASAGPAAFAGAPAAPSPGVAAVTAAAQGQPAPDAAPAPIAPGVAKVSGAMNPAALQAFTSPYADSGTKALAGMVIQKQLAEGQKEHFTPHTDAAGNDYDVGSNGERHMFSKADEKTPAQKDYEYYKANFQPTDQQPNPMGFDTWTTAKARAAAANNSITTNVDTKEGDSYDSQMTGGLAKSHAALVNGVEGAQGRARDINAMQAAVDAIQKNGGTTGGMAPEQVLKLQKSINSGASALGITEPFDEKDLSDKEFLTKFNRTMAGAQAKDSVGSRVTNFEMSNYLKSNPGLDMSITGNQRLLGIQGQIEQRNIDVGNALRAETAKGISSGKHIDPVTAQKIITDYDEAHHIQDPVTGQDLTKNYALPEFNRTGQGGSSNAAMAADHSANVGKLQRTNTGVTWSVQQ